VTTSFLFWAALIKATRDWGGSSAQGVAFGILDGGRGLAAAMLGAIAVGILANYLPEQLGQTTSADRRAGMGNIISYYAAITLACAVLVWFLVPHDERSVKSGRNPFAGLLEVIRRPLAWSQAGIIICAYCGYKGVDNYSLYAVQVLGKNEVEAALLSTYGFYVRPVGALMAGVIADRFGSARSILVMFLAMVVAYGVLSFATLETATLFVIYANLFVTLFAVFAIRGIYYALLEETRTPRHLTGGLRGVHAGDFLWPGHRSYSRCESRHPGLSQLFPVPGDGVCDRHRHISGTIATKPKAGSQGSRGQQLAPPCAINLPVKFARS